jgi:hypothetical protein
MSDTQTSATEVLDLSARINDLIGKVDALKKQLSKYREMLDSIYANDPTFQLHDSAVKEATKVRNGTKKQLQKLPQAADLAARIQDSRNQIKELNDSLSEYLLDYQKNTGSFQIEGEDGQIREIVYSAKLVRKNEFRP